MTLLDFTHSFLQSLLFTVAVEVLVVLVITRRVFKKTANDLSTQKLIGIGLFASFATLPYVWYVFPSLLHPFSFAVAIGEIFAVVVETAFYVVVLPLSKKESLMLSIAANATSYILGKLI